MPITNAEIKVCLSNALAAHLGTYSYAGASGSIPAIRIDDGSEADSEFLEEPTVTGLEVVIEPNNNNNTQALLGGDYLATNTTRVTLKQWDRTKTVSEAWPAVLKELGCYIDRVTPKRPRNKQLDAVEAQSFFIVQNGA